MATYLLARGCLAGAQDDRDRPAGRSVVDVDRQKAALIVMRIEERKLLVAVDDIEGVVDVERHRYWRGGVAGAIEIDHHAHQANKVAQGWRVLPARDGGLRAQIDAAVGQPATGELEGRIQAQPVEVVGILVAAGDRENAGAQDIGQPMSDPALIAAVRDHRGEPFGEAQPPLRLGEQHHPAIGGEPAANEGGGHLFAHNGWKAERQQAIVGHGGCGSLRSRRGMASTPNFYAISVAYATSASPNSPLS